MINIILVQGILYTEGPESNTPNSLPGSYSVSFLLLSYVLFSCLLICSVLFSFCHVGEDTISRSWLSFGKSCSLAVAR